MKGRDGGLTFEEYPEIIIQNKVASQSTKRESAPRKNVKECQYESFAVTVGQETGASFLVPVVYRPRS